MTVKHNKTRKVHKPTYPDWLNVEALDAMISTSANPMGQLADMQRFLMQRILEAELNHHLEHSKGEESPDGNYRNGYGSKTVKTDHGTVDIKTPRDRDGTFNPQLIAKRQRSFKGFDEKIISMYGLGMSMRDIQSHIQDMYKMDVSPELISTITDEVMHDVSTWQDRALDSVYPILYLDAMVIKVKDGRQVINKSLYMAMGVTLEGKKDVLGMWLKDQEGSKFWLGVLHELKNRGVQDVLIACCDGLTGFPEAIRATFPGAVVQLCIVHMIRNSVKYVSYKNLKEVCTDLKTIYTADSEATAEKALSAFENKWDSQYPMIGQSWRRHWSDVTAFLGYPETIRKAIYTTNVIEASNRQVRKVIKTKGAFPSDEAVYKIVYLVLHRVRKKWTMPVKDWPLALNQFFILFPGRLGL
jgi:putative transposase